MICQDLSIEELNKLLKNQSTSEKKDDFHSLVKRENHYSRIIAVGWYKVIEIIEKKNIETKKLDEILPVLSELIGYSKDRLRKDILSYISNLDKIDKALELIEMNIKDERRRREKKQ